MIGSNHDQTEKLSRYLPRRKIFSQGSRCAGRDSNRPPSEHNSQEFVISYYLKLLIV
jgi:hypothetical protein